jgi:hypothetical protein
MRKDRHYGIAAELDHFTTLGRYSLYHHAKKAIEQARYVFWTL